MFSRSTLLLFTVLLVLNTFGQNQWGMDLTYKNGFLAAHRSSMAHIPKEMVSALEASWWVDLKEGEGFRTEYDIPRIGFTALVTQTGNTPLLGHGLGLMANSELPFKRTEKAFFTSRVGFGAGFVSKVFDQELNPKNFAVSTKVNLLICLGLKAGIFINDSRLALGADVTHFSNAAWKTPNLGLNYLFLSVGYSRNIGTLKKLRYSQKISQPTGWTSRAYFIGSGKEIFPTGGRRYPIWGIYGNIKKTISSKVGMEAGLDLIYRSSTKAYLPEFSKREIDLIQLGVYTGYAFTFDRFSTTLGMGCYLRDFYQPDGPFYHRIGLRYQCTERLDVALVLKSVWGKADYMEYCVGYKLFER